MGTATKEIVVTPGNRVRVTTSNGMNVLIESGRLWVDGSQAALPTVTVSRGGSPLQVRFDRLIVEVDPPGESADPPETIGEQQLVYRLRMLNECGDAHGRSAKGTLVSVAEHATMKRFVVGQASDGRWLAVRETREQALALCERRGWVLT